MFFFPQAGGPLSLVLLIRDPVSFSRWPLKRTFSYLFATSVSLLSTSPLEPHHRDPVYVMCARRLRSTSELSNKGNQGSCEINKREVPINGDRCYLYRTEFRLSEPPFTLILSSEHFTDQTQHFFTEHPFLLPTEMNFYNDEK